MTSSFQEALEGEAAIEYAKKHLEKVEENAETWEITYVDPLNGEMWLLDYPNSGDHAGGVPRLRRRL